MSGGQTGADRAALDFAIEHDIPHGGWCPRGRKAQDGIIDARYQLKETPTAVYGQRTDWNVRDSDGTALFSIAAVLTKKLKKTVALAHKYGKPVLHISQNSGLAQPAQELLRLIHEYDIKVLNVAGPRTSKEPGICEFVVDVLQKALTPAIGATVQFRLIRESEAEEVSELALRVFEEFVASEHNAKGQEEFYRNTSAAALRDGHASGWVTFVAESQGHIIGMLQLRNGSHIAMLLVEGRHQRRGIGSGLVCAAEQYALVQQPCMHALTVASTPIAINAYRRMGFAITGEEQVLRGLRFVPMERIIGRSPQ